MTRRVELAAGLIERTDRSLTDIALAVGFADHSHFTRTFARMKGETPGAYRRRHR
jgi:transcriptional regulator GlxA family with amidase domain